MFWDRPSGGLLHGWEKYGIITPTAGRISSRAYHMLLSLHTWMELGRAQGTSGFTVGFWALYLVLIQGTELNWAVWEPEAKRQGQSRSEMRRVQCRVRWSENMWVVISKEKGSHHKDVWEMEQLWNISQTANNAKMFLRVAYERPTGTLGWNGLCPVIQSNLWNKFISLPGLPKNFIYVKYPSLMKIHYELPL